MLRSLYVLPYRKNFFWPGAPLFSDVERDLDVYAVADKYDLQPLKRYMSHKIVLFYETDQRPPLDPKGWSAKNQTGFAKVLTKLYRLEMDTTDIRKAVIDFIVRGVHKVILWEGVRKAIEEDAGLSGDLVTALLAAKRGADLRIGVLEANISDLDAELEEVLCEKEGLEAELEDLAGLVRGFAFEMVCPWDRYEMGEEAYYRADEY
jgi:hypothetical protein